VHGCSALGMLTDNVLNLIGRTPLIRLKNESVFAKAEFLNPGGSIKDRVALAMIEGAERDGRLRSDSIVVEPSSGNTGIGVALVGRLKGYKVRIVMPENMSEERKKLIRTLGADLVLTPAKEGIAGAVARVRQMQAEDKRVFVPQQFENPDNPRVHYEETARELWRQMNGNIAAFVAGVGSGGTLQGVGKFLREHKPGVRIVAVEPKNVSALLGHVKDLDGYFPFHPPATREAWERRAERVRRRILVSQGLWPLPTRTPLNAVIHGRLERDEYTVEKVYFESAPGFFVTGNLYRPKRVTGRVPGVLFAHGHWQDARLALSGEEEVRREIATGQERFEQGGRSRFQSLCVQLARMGCVVWQWDMLGNSDAQQLSAALVHGFAKQRPEMATPENWGLFSPQAELHLQSAMGLQTWNSIRSLDFLLSLPEVDPERVAMTGASGGGTQTMILAAIDERLKLSFPAVMVSTAMQGGCTCENACLLRVDTGNVEFAALFAPKPQGLTTADDWTREMATKVKRVCSRRLPKAGMSPGPKSGACWRPARRWPAWTCCIKASSWPMANRCNKLAE
jgi:cysteine synthase/dienelactone hydrolase